MPFSGEGLFPNAGSSQRVYRRPKLNVSIIQALHIFSSIFRFYVCFYSMVERELK